MTKNTAGLTEPIWDSRNSDEPMPTLDDLKPKFDTNPPPPEVGLPVGNAPPIPPPGTAVEPGLPPAEVPAFWSDPQNFVAAAARWIADDPELQALVVAWIEALKAKISQRK